jgi:hypothetical protein
MLAAARLVIPALVVAVAGARCAGSPIGVSDACTAPASPFQTVIGSCVLPSRGDGEVRVSGLSGAYYDPGERILWTVSDDPDAPRFVRFDLSLEPGLRLRIRDAIAATTGAGELEGIAPGNGFLWVVTENDRAPAGAPRSSVFRCQRNGRCEEAAILPPLVVGGLRTNRGLESVTTSPDGRWLFLAVETALASDGDEASRQGGARTRLLAYDTRGDPAPRQYAYQTDPWPAAAGTGETSQLGVSEVLAISDTELVVLERGYFEPCGNTIRLFQVALDPGSEIPVSSDAPATMPLTKRLLLDLGDERATLHERLRARLENFEGLSWGPALAGARTLLLIGDDNAGIRMPAQVNALVAVRWEALPTARAREWRGEAPTCAG